MPRGVELRGMVTVGGAGATLISSTGRWGWLWTVEQLVRRPNGAQGSNVIPASSPKGDAARMITFTGGTLAPDGGSEPLVFQKRNRERERESERKAREEERGCVRTRAYVCVPRVVRPSLTRALSAHRKQFREFLACVANAVIWFRNRFLHGPYTGPVWDLPTTQWALRLSEMFPWNSVPWRRQRRVPMALLRGDSAGQDLPSLRDLPSAKLGRFIISRLNAERERERELEGRGGESRQSSIQGELRSVAGCVDVSHRKAYSAHGTYRSSSDILPLRLGTLPVIA